MPVQKPCRRCGKLLLTGRGSLPEPMCQPCRRIEPQRNAKAPKQPRSVIARGSTAARGYGRDHQYRRAVALADFTPGAPCVRCRKPMAATDPIELDHTPDRSGYLGLSHGWCNRSHRPGGTTRPESRQRSCVICSAPFRMKRSDQRACSRVCGTALRLLNLATA